MQNSKFKTTTQNLKLITIIFVLVLMVLPSVVSAGQAEGGTFNRVDVQPRNIDSGSSLSFILQFTVYETEYDNNCGGFLVNEDLYVAIIELSSAGNFRIFNDQIPRNTFPISNGIARMPLSPSILIADRGATANNRQYYALLECNVNTGIHQIDRSSTLPVTVNSLTSGTGVNGSPVQIGFNLTSPLGASSLIGIFDLITNWLLTISLPIVVILIIWAGLAMLLSGGNESRYTKAKHIIWYAVLGYSIILIGKGFITLIISILNL
jgi:hypothetical protein